MNLYFWYSKLMNVVAKFFVFALLSLIAVALIKVVFVAMGWLAMIIALFVMAIICAWAYDKIV